MFLWVCYIPVLCLVLPQNGALPTQIDLTLWTSPYCKKYNLLIDKSLLFLGLGMSWMMSVSSPTKSLASMTWDVQNLLVPTRLHSLPRRAVSLRLDYGVVTSNHFQRNPVSLHLGYRYYSPTFGLLLFQRSKDSPGAMHLSSDQNVLKA